MVKSYCFSNGPDGADVDTLYALEGENAPKQSRDNDEDAGAEQDTNGNLASSRQLDLPKQGYRNADNGDVGTTGGT